MNKVCMSGRLVKDIDLKKSKENTSIASFSLAVNRPFAKDKTDFFNCVAFKQNADYLNTYASKGTLVELDGTLQTRTYENKEGKKVYVTEIMVNDCHILESKKKEETKTVAEEDLTPFGEEEGDYQND